MNKKTNYNDNHIINIIEENIIEIMESKIKMDKFPYEIETTNEKKDYIVEGDMFDYIKEKCIDHILNLLLLEISMLSDFENEKSVTISKKIAITIDEEQGNINGEYGEDEENSFQTEPNRYESLNESYSSIKKQFSSSNKKNNLIAYHVVDNSLAMLDITSFGSLLYDFNLKFNYRYFMNELSCIYMHNDDQILLSSSKEYLSFLADKLRIKTNIYYYCEQLQELALSNDKNKRNYASRLKSIENRYNEYSKSINTILKKENKKGNMENYITTKILFDSFLHFKFFNSINSNIFDYLSKSIDILFLHAQQNNETLKFSSFDRFKIQDSLFKINLLRLMMLFDIDMNKLDPCTNYQPLSASSIFFINDESSILQTRLGYEQYILTQKVLMLIYDILLECYTSAGIILQECIESLEPSLSKKTLALTKKELCKIYVLRRDELKSYDPIKINQYLNSNFKKQQSLLICYLLHSNINHKVFYNLHFE